MAKADRLSHVPVTATRTALAIGVVAMLATLAATTPARAQGAWCAEYGGSAGGTNCGFYTFKQCQEAISGMGGFCSPSPWASTNNPQQRRGVRRREW